MVFGDGGAGRSASWAFATAVLIPAREFQPGGGGNGRAMAYLAHLYLGNGFGTAYDISTIAILWFAGASAMAGLLNLVPRYLPRYGMAPAWALAARPLVLVFAADMDAQAGAYATGVMRAYELRATGITFDETAAGFLRAAVPAGVINVIANEPDEREYQAKWQVSRVPEDEPAVFLEVSVADASEFEADLEIRGEERFGYKVLTVSSAAVPNGIAAICLAMRDEFGLIPHVYFDWTEGSPLIYFLRFILWGSSEVAPVTREILRRAEPDRSRRPHCTWAEDRPDPATANYKRVMSPGGATLARIAWPSSAGLVNCGQWPVGRSM